MTDFNRLLALAQACVQVAREVEDPETAVMLLETAHRLLDRIVPDIQAFNCEQIHTALH
jgi:hypothetical protein